MKVRIKQSIRTTFRGEYRSPIAFKKGEVCDLEEWDASYLIRRRFAINVYGPPRSRKRYQKKVSK